jgi:Raf kinase inhibitor-like YbhB/YbcL family protein
MIKIQWAILVCLALLVLPTGFSTACAESFSLSSPLLEDGGKLAEKQVFNGFGCSGGNLSPELSWKNPPVGTKSFAVTLYDPDAPTGSGWWHWVMFNIPGTTRSLVADAGNADMTKAPQGSVQSLTDFGKPGYGGACPPEGHGPHHYIFTIYALDVTSLALDASAMPAMVGFYLNQHTIGKAQLSVLYSR